MMAYDVIVIGAGVNGLTAAAYLARAGRRVLVLERGTRVGGTASIEEFHPGFHARACRDHLGWIPSRLWRDLRLNSAGLRLTHALVGLVAACPGAPPIATWPDARRTAESLRSIAPRDADRWNDFCALIANVTRVLATLYATAAPRVQSRAAGDLLALLSLGRRVRRLGRREAMEVVRAIPMPIADLLDEWVTEPTLAGAIAALGIRYVQHGPLSGGTGFVFFHHHTGAARGSVGVRQVVERVGKGELGAGGGSALVEALESVLRAAGGEIRIDTPVTQILVQDSAVRGVAVASGDEFSAPVVLSNADPHRTFALVDPIWLDSELLGAVDNIRTRGSTARAHFAIDGLPAFSTEGKPWDAEWLQGSIVVSPGLMGIERAYDDAKYGQMPGEPALTLSIPSLADASLAPAGRHVVSVDVHHAPFARTGGWGPTEREALGDLVEGQLTRVAWDFRDRVLHRWVLTPTDLEARYGVTGGSLTHGELALDQILFMRPVPQCSRYATPLPGLWLCSVGTHPASASGVSGMLAAKALLASD